VLVSIVVPVLDDAEAAAALLYQVPPDPRVEIVLADGGCDARLETLAAAREDTRLVRSAPGRGVQMNAGAAAARGAWLLFLHADSRLPTGWLTTIERLPATAQAGHFRFALDDRAWQARVIERGVRWRVRWLGLPYGDQGIFVRPDLFARIGGYPALPLMEDVAIVRRLSRETGFIELDLPLVTSARRWRRDGWWRRSGRNLLLILLYFAGVSPWRLTRWYVPRDSTLPRPVGRRE
jgi:rSAM/selenodomain-associated transferase 2